MEAWLEPKPKVEQWTEAVRTLSDITRKYPQPAYAGLTMSLQQEWQYVSWVVPGAGQYMHPIEDALHHKKFLPNLLDATMDGDLRKLRGQRVKNAGLGIPNPVEMAGEQHMMSKA